MKIEKLVETLTKFTSKNKMVNPVYRSFSTGSNPQLPYLIYLTQGREDLHADNKNFIKNYAINIELYQEERDFNLEEKLESFFNENDIIFDVIFEDFIESENMYETVYSFTI